MKDGTKIVVETTVYGIDGETSREHQEMTREQLDAWLGRNVPGRTWAVRDALERNGNCSFMLGLSRIAIRRESA